MVKMFSLENIVCVIGTFVLLLEILMQYKEILALQKGVLFLRAKLGYRNQELIVAADRIAYITQNVKNIGN